MNSQQWQQVRNILDKAIALTGAERSRYLEAACSKDASLRSEVDSLLRSHESAGSVFLKTPAVDLNIAVAENVSNRTRIGCRIGVYQITEEIGVGGMGEVYRAVRADGQYDKEVAIKLVRVGLDAPILVERFRHERQILASLDHPNIARLLDGGTTEDGIPYLVMELISGDRVDTYCDLCRLSITQRLELFCQICSAVQYAHQHLVIHRDLKPSNVLVTAEGIPKLLDFGIAKLLDPSAMAETTLVRAMTPEYASPEQVRGDPITTASDVYSLGVVLYQLLTGRSPYPQETRSSHELARAVCETDPGKPSAVVLKPPPPRADEQAPSPTAEQISISRESSPAKLHRRLAGDLDNIVLMALRKEPQRRYPSVEQFAEDIRRHLQGLPIAAVKGSFRYRAAKFTGRHRVVIAAGAAVMMALLVGLGATIREARIARRQAEIATAERARAEKRFNDVRELANSLIFEIHDSIQTLPGATPSRKLLLDRAVQYLDKLAQDAAGDVNLQRELAWAYHRLATVQGDTTQSNLGQVRAAEISNRKAMALFESVAKANPNSLTDQLNLAMAYRWRAFLDVFDPAGLSEINRAIAVTEPLMHSYGDNADLKNERAQEYYILAEIQDATGHRLEAIDSFRKVLDLRLEILHANPTYPDNRRGVAKATVLLAHQIGRFGSKEEGIRLMNTGIAEFQELVKEAAGDPGLVREVSAAEGRRANVEMMLGNVGAARADIQRSLQRIKHLAQLDPENKMLQSDVAGADFHNAMALVYAARYTEAMPILERAFQSYQSLHLEDEVWPGLSTMHAWIGEAQAGRHNFNEALKSYEAAATGLAADESNFDDARCDLAMVETKMGNVLLKLGRVEEAKAEYEKALATANLETSLEHHDFPALYAAAEANSGLGDLAMFEARRASDRAQQSKLTNEACASYERSLNVWKQILNPARLSGNGYLSLGPEVIAQRLAACRSGASPTSSSTVAGRQPR